MISATAPPALSSPSSSPPCSHFRQKQEGEPCFRVDRVPLKGLGAICTRAIVPGECIMRENPFVTLELSKEGDLLGQFDSESGEFRCHQLEIQLRVLSDEQLTKFYSLTDVFGDALKDGNMVEVQSDATGASSIKRREIPVHNGSCDPPPSSGKGGVKTNLGIIKTNSFTVSRGPRSLLVLFPDVARINHSCAPNCHHYWSKKSGEFVIRAVRNLAEGEELSISYMSPLQRADFHDRDARRRILKDEFGFHCLCDICIDSDSNSVATTDRRRRRILEIEAAWTELGKNPESALELGEEQYRLCSDLKFQSGLLSYVALHCVEAASLVVAKKRSSPIEAEEFRATAVRYARLAFEQAAVAYGDVSEEYGIFLGVITTCEGESNMGMVTAVQSAIASLRDIDA